MTEDRPPYMVPLNIPPGWQAVDEGRAILRRYRFAGFAEAFAFMTQVALAAERADHHPDWHHRFDTVEVRWTTHEAGGLTALDLQLAAATDAAAWQHGAR